MTDPRQIERETTPPPPAYPAEAPEPPPQTRRVDAWTVILGIIGGVLLGTGVTFAILGVLGIFEEPEPPPPPTIPPAPVLTAPSPTGPPPTFGESITATAVAARVIPSTVAIVTSSLFGQEGGGSGVIYGSDGYVITNHHVIEGNDEVAVIFADGARFPARVVGSDPVTDIGVLLVNRDDLTPLEIGSSTDLAIGEPAVAVGNPLGLEGGPTVTSGIVSALDRSLEVTLGTFLYGMVQTDAPIAPGSSGGALVDAEGRLIGITTAIAVSDVGAEGLGFAVPIDLAVGVANDLIETGEVRHARLGIEGSTAWAAEGRAEFPVGVGVEDLTSVSAFEDAGGQINDVIVAVAGTQVETLEGLLGTLRRHRSGDEVEVRILRGDTERAIQVTLGSLD